MRLKTNCKNTNIKPFTFRDTLLIWIAIGKPFLRQNDEGTCTLYMSYALFDTSANVLVFNMAKNSQNIPLIDLISLGFKIESNILSGVFILFILFIRNTWTRTGLLK